MMGTPVFCLGKKSALVLSVYYQLFSWKKNVTASNRFSTNTCNRRAWFPGCIAGSLTPYMYSGKTVGPPASTILRLYAHSCSAELSFFSAEHFLPLPSILRLCRVFFSAMPNIFQPCWPTFCSAKLFSSIVITCFLCHALFFCADLSSSEHFSLTLSTARLFPSFLFYAERCFGSSKHFSDILSMPCSTR